MSMQTNPATTKAPSPSLDDATDEQLLDECAERGCLPAEREIDDFSDDDLRFEYQSRFGVSVDPMVIYEEFRTRGDAPQCLRDYLYEATGRILP